MKNIKTLAKELDFNTQDQYFEYLIESHINGNFSQCKRLFLEMKRVNRKEFITYLSDSEGLKNIRDFYFNLL
jgi:hypothetical protein